MTDNQIIEELQDEVDYARVYNLRFINSVSAVLLAEALALINRQKTEVEKAQKVIEKQTPKKPFDIEKRSDACHGRCPSCGRMVGDFRGSIFCRGCGQALDWMEVGENEL